MKSNKQKNKKQNNGFSHLDDCINQNYLYINNRRLSVITEEKTSALSSRCGSTEKTNAIV